MKTRHPVEGSFW